MIHSRRNKTTAFFLTLIFPFGGLIYTLCHWREKWAKNTFWLACIYLGAVLVYWPEGSLLGEGADGGRYVLNLIDMYGSNISLLQILGRYQIDQRTMDLYQPLMTYLISRFTDNGHVLFAAFAVVFGYFYSRNIWYILEKLPKKRLGNLFVLVTLYFLICPITLINGVRMWTALHVFVYAMMPYLVERKKSKLWWLLLTPLIHFSYLYVVLFAVAFVLLPYRLKSRNNVLLYVAYAFFIVTLFINSINLDATGGMLAELSPETYEGRIEGYVNQDVADRKAEASALNNWYVAGSANILHWSYNLLLLALLPCLNRHFKNNRRLMGLFVFTLLLAGFANIMALIPSGGRFQLLAQMFKVPLILWVAMSISKSDNFRKLVNVALIFLLVPFVVELRKLFDFFSITAIVGNFITIFFWENNIPLISFIKRLI
ncbi:MAG: hypothetical protein IJK78_00560 [Bacteroidales bacterium]|nr:hypothetical protein [Bacteroidales bacterium]